MSSDHILSWFSWQNATLPNGKEKLQKLSFQGSFDAFSELKLQTPAFLMHDFVKEKQSAAFKMDHDFSDTNFDTTALLVLTLQTIIVKWGKNRTVKNEG